MTHNAAIVKSLLDEAFRVLRHDTDADLPETAHMRVTLGKEFWRVLLAPQRGHSDVGDDKAALIGMEQAFSSSAMGRRDEVPFADRHAETPELLALLGTPLIDAIAQYDVRMKLERALSAQAIPLPQDGGDERVAGLLPLMSCVECGFINAHCQCASKAAPIAVAEPNALPQAVLDALRFYAHGHHFNIDADHQRYDTVSGEAQNLLFSERDGDCSFVEDGSVARDALRGDLTGFEEGAPDPIEGEVFNATPCAPIAVAKPTPWRCFHCDETFIDEAAAREHFGPGQEYTPACQIDVAEYRSMEERVRRSDEEDTDLHREIHGLQAKHRTALIREEEKGYAHGLAAGRALGVALTNEYADTLRLAMGYIGSSERHDRHEHIARIRIMLDPSAPGAVAEPEPRTHTTTPGESVMGIALRQCGNEKEWRHILACNPKFAGMLPHEYFPVGTVLTLPRTPVQIAATGEAVLDAAQPANGDKP